MWQLQRSAVVLKIVRDRSREPRSPQSDLLRARPRPTVDGATVR